MHFFFFMVFNGAIDLHFTVVPFYLQLFLVHKTNCFPVNYFLEILSPRFHLCSRVSLGQPLAVSDTEFCVIISNVGNSTLLSLPNY